MTHPHPAKNIAHGDIIDVWTTGLALTVGIEHLRAEAHVHGGVIRFVTVGDRNISARDFCLDRNSAVLRANAIKKRAIDHHVSELARIRQLSFE